MRPHRLLALAVGAVLAAIELGCAGVPPKGGFDSIETLTSERGAAPIRWATEPGETDAIAAQTAPLLAGEIDADQAARVALLRNPTLQGQYEALGIAQADFVRAALPSNPVVSGALMPGLSGGLGRQQIFDLTHNLLELLLIPSRTALASAEFEATKLRVAHEVIQLVTGTRAAYYDLVSKQNLVVSLQAIDAANEAAATFAEGLYRAGNLSERDLTSQRSLREETQLAVLEAEADVAEARARLERLLATRPGENMWRVTDRLPALPPSDPDVAALESEAADRRLDVLAAGASTRALAQALAIARHWRWVPLLEVGVSSERQPEGGWNLGPSLSIALPIFDQGQPNVARLESGLRRGERDVDAARLDARSDVREAAARLAGARARAERLRNTTIPIRERLVRLTTEEYNYMLVGAFDLLVAKRDELGAYRQYLGSVRDYWIAFSDLEGAVGRRIEVSDVSPDSPTTDPAADPHAGHSMPMKDSSPSNDEPNQPEPHHKHGDM